MRIISKVTVELLFGDDGEGHPFIAARSGQKPEIVSADIRDILFAMQYQHMLLDLHVYAENALRAYKPDGEKAQDAAQNVIGYLNHLYEDNPLTLKEMHAGKVEVSNN